MFQAVRSPAAAAFCVLLAVPAWCEAGAAKPQDFGTDGTQGRTLTRAASPSSIASVSSVIENVPISAALYDQTAVFILPPGGGGLIAVWADSREGNYDIYAQKLNAADDPQWSSGGVPVCKAAGNQTSPRAISDGAGGVIVVWEDDRGGSLDIYAQRVNSLGIAAWTPGGVLVSGAANAQRDPVACANGFGGVIIAWVDERGADADVYAQRLSATGAPQWTADGVALCTEVGAQEGLEIASDNQGGGIVAWRDDRLGDPSSDIYARRVNEAGNPQWAANGVAVCDAAGDQEAVSAASDGTGGLVLAWEDARGANRDIYAQRITSNGGAHWPAQGVLVSGAAGDQRAPRVCADGAGGGLLVWEDGRGGESDIYAAHVTDAGAVPWTVGGVPVCVAPGDQLTPSISSDLTGGAVTSWKDARTPGSTDVYTQRLLLDGSRYWTPDGVLICNAPGVQDLPLVLSSGVGGATTVWRDYRGGAYADLYSQRVDENGQVPDQCTPPDSLSSGLVVSTVAPQNYRTFQQARFYWAGVAVRGSAGTDWDLEVFDQGGYGLAPYPSCFGLALAGSYGSQETDFVIANFNDFHTPPGTYGVRAYRYSGTDAAQIEWDDDQNQLPIASSANPTAGYTSAADWIGPLDVFDVPLTAGTNYTFELTHAQGADLRMLVFSSYGSPSYSYVVPRSARVMESAGRYGVYTPPSSEYYGVAVVNENGVAGSYTIKVWSTTPTGVGDGVATATGLRRIAPNPSSGPVEIRFAMQEPGDVSFEVFDMAGRVVASMPPQRWEPGSWSIPWDGRGRAGQRLSTGIYFVRMSVDGRSVATSRLALVR